MIKFYDSRVDYGMNVSAFATGEVLACMEFDCKGTKGAGKKLKKSVQPKMNFIKETKKLFRKSLSCVIYLLRRLASIDFVDHSPA